MGGESVGFQIVSDQGECLRSVVTGRANYEDEFYSVSKSVPIDDNGDSTETVETIHVFLLEFVSMQMTKWLSQNRRNLATLFCSC